MARRVADDELAAGRGEIAVSHVDSDALLAFGRQAVGEQRQVGFARALHARQLVLQHHLAVHQQPADQRALAIVDRAAGDELERGYMVMLGCSDARLALARDQVDDAHQKYPSFLRFSMEASEVLSSMRVAPRSLTSTLSVSTTTSAALAAGLSTGQVQVISPTVRKRTVRVTTSSPARAGVSSVSGTSSPLRSTTCRGWA